jgi:hypothetical protein
LLGPLLIRLTRGDSRGHLSEYLWREVEDHFGLDPVGCRTISLTRSWRGTQPRAKAPSN